jgi:hypothetical protein
MPWASRPRTPPAEGTRCLGRRRGGYGKDNYRESNWFKFQEAVKATGVFPDEHRAPDIRDDGTDDVVTSGFIWSVHALKDGGDDNA